MKKFGMSALMIFCCALPMVIIGIFKDRHDREMLEEKIRQNNKKAQANGKPNDEVE